MTKLPPYAKALLLLGASTTGNFTDGYRFVEENLYSRHAEVLHRFCQWIDARIGGAGSGNIDMLYAAFTHPEDTALAAQAETLAQRIAEIRNR